MNSRRRLLPVLSLALIAVLVFAASAAAEAKVGEATSPVDESLNGEIDLLKATAYYDPTTGTASFAVTTRKEPTEKAGQEVFGAIYKAEGPCETAAFPENVLFPVLEIESPYTKPTETEAQYDIYEEPGPPIYAGPASKVVEGTTTTLAAPAPKAANQPFDCAIVQAAESSGGSTVKDLLVFPIASPPTPAPEKIVEVKTIEETVTVTKTVTESAPTTKAPVPAALTIPAIKPVTANSKKWTKVKVAVTNSGGTASGPVGIKLKAPKGVTVSPGALSLPALLPGQTWNVPVRVKVAEGAKGTSSVTVAASLPGISTSSSFTVKTAP